MQSSHGLRTLRTTVLVLAVAVPVAGCGEHESIFNSPAAPSAPAAATAGVLNVAFEPRAIQSGAAAQAVVFLTLPAPATGLAVQLTGTAPLTVPAVVTVPPGADQVPVPIAVGFVARDTRAAVTASGGGRNVTREVDLWADVPTFFNFFSEQGNFVGGGEFRRLTPENATFTARVDVLSAVTVNMVYKNESWHAEFAAPARGPLRIGSYENARRYPFNDNLPGLTIGGRSRGCNMSLGRFDVLELELGPNNQVRRFWARFQHRCTSDSGGMTGEVRFIG